MKKLILTIAIVIMLMVALIVWIAFVPNCTTNDPNGRKMFYLHKNSTAIELQEALEKGGFIKNKFTLKVFISIYKPNATFRLGAFEINDKMSNITLIKTIYRGIQTPIKLRINSVRFPRQLVDNICSQTNIDSLALTTLLTNDTIWQQRYGLTTTTCMSMFIPNTYEVYWTITPERLLDRMKKEYDNFWSKERIAKAKAIPLTPMEVIILASIVDEETRRVDEKPMVAGLYINRLHRGIKLQADPTARYALGNFTLNQVYFSHTKIDSPYNTYIYKGLPPGPIRIPSISGIDAVLNYSKHNYIFMCAKPELNGHHNYSTTYKQHQKYAKEYYKALKEWKKRNG